MYREFENPTRIVTCGRRRDALFGFSWGKSRVNKDGSQLALIARCPTILADFRISSRVRRYACCRLSFSSVISTTLWQASSFSPQITTSWKACCPVGSSQQSSKPFGTSISTMSSFFTREHTARWPESQAKGVLAFSIARRQRA